MALHAEQQKAELKIRTNKKVICEKKNKRQVQEDRIIRESYMNRRITQYDFVKAMCFKLSPVQM